MTRPRHPTSRTFLTDDELQQIVHKYFDHINGVKQIRWGVTTLRVMHSRDLYGDDDVLRATTVNEDWNPRLSGGNAGSANPNTLTRPGNAGLGGIGKGADFSGGGAGGCGPSHPPTVIITPKPKPDPDIPIFPKKDFWDRVDEQRLASLQQQASRLDRVGVERCVMGVDLARDDKVDAAVFAVLSAKRVETIVRRRPWPEPFVLGPFIAASLLILALLYPDIATFIKGWWHG